MEVTARLSWALDCSVSGNYVGNSMIEELTCSASLAYHNHSLLGSMSSLILRNVDLSPVPAKQMTSLATSVTTLIHIENISGCDLHLVNLLSSVNCKELVISRQSLGKEETRALVQAMESGVESVELKTGSTFDKESLAAYSGQGKCGAVAFWWDRYSTQDAETWATLRHSYWLYNPMDCGSRTFIKMNRYR